MLWKGVAANMKLRDLNLHLQGLYAELGKWVYELQGKKPRAGSRRSREVEDLFDKIAEMRSKKSRVEQARRSGGGGAGNPQGLPEPCDRQVRPLAGYAQRNVRHEYGAER